MILRFTEPKQNYFAKVKIGFRHNTDEWDRYIADVRRKFPKEVEDIVDKTTTSISRGAKASVPKVHGGIKSSISSRVQKNTGEVTIRAHYAPYVEFGTGKLVKVPSELSEYAMQFKGKGLREVNQKSQPFFYPHFFLQRHKFFESIERLLQKI